MKSHFLRLAAFAFLITLLQTGTTIAAAPPHLVKDINTTRIPASSGVHDLCAVGSTLFFATTDGTHGRGLWKSDGTFSGTVLVKEILNGSNSPQLTSLTAVGSALYFVSSDYATYYKLWKSDGTETGTVMVKEIAGGSSYISDLTAVGNMLYFRANDGTNGLELWKSNGTEAGTTQVKDINPGGAVRTPLI
ncbi:hypothetical protein BH11VER1_BH11VER1_31020 [soil metagenome]